MSSNLSMPDLGVGTFRLTGETVYKSVKTAIDLGYRHVDTAQIYGNEKEVGDAIRDSGIAREFLFVTTKVWNDKLNAQDFLPSVKESLEKLQMNYVDLLLIHWPTPANGDDMEIYLAELTKCQDMGLCMHIGVSNFTIAQLEKAQSILKDQVLYTNQVEVHPYLQNRELRRYCDSQNIHVTGYMPFAVGKVLKDPTVINVAAQQDCSVAEVVIAWSLAKGMSTIPSSTKRENLYSNLKGRDIQLSDKQIAMIDALDRGDRQASPDFSPEWD